MGEISAIPYFFFPDPMFGCQPTAAPFWLGAAAMVLTLSFFGFFDSRLPFCSPLAMPLSLDFQRGNATVRVYLESMSNEPAQMTDSERIV
jgi:hypothetical protein